MDVHHVLLFCFLSGEDSLLVCLAPEGTYSKRNINQKILCISQTALCGGNTGLVSVNVPIYTGPEGGNGTIYCLLTPSASNKFFCKNQCEAEDLLIETDGATAESGRYSLRVDTTSSGQEILSVTITNMTKSDSGRYRCAMGRTSVQDIYSNFDIRVSDELLKNSSFVPTQTVGQNFSFQCNTASATGNTTFLCKSPCANPEDVLVDTSNSTAHSSKYSIAKGSGNLLYATITQVTKSDTGFYRCGYGKPATSLLNSWVRIIIIDADTDPTQSRVPSSVQVPLVVSVSLVVALLSAVLLLFFHRRQKRTVNAGRNISGHNNQTHTESVIYENDAAGPSYEQIDPAARDPDYSTVKKA